MADEIVDIFEKPFRPLEAMSKAEMEDEVRRWRNVWTWIEPEPQLWLTNVNRPFVAHKRNNDRIEGILGQPHFDLVSIDIEWVERLYNYGKGEATYEHKTTTIKLGDMIDYSLIHGKEVKAEKYDGSPLEAEVDDLESIVK